jgi:phosphoserine phosphatase RsbU/P
MALFEGVAAEVLQPLLKQCEIRELQPGEILLAPGEPNPCLYLVLRGRLEAHIDKADSEKGFVITPGECTGEISIIDGKLPTAFVVAVVPSVVLVLPETILWDGFLSNSRINRNFMRLMAERFRGVNRAMQQALEQELRYEHLQKELAIARDIQSGMLPRALDLGLEVDIAAEMVPAQEVGGDFYDVFPIGGDSCCVVVADVSGKGVPAALFMVRTMALLRAELLRDQALEDALGRVNVLLCEDNPTCMFATLAVAIVNRRTGHCQYANAGHDPIVFGQEGSVYRALPQPRGVLVGVDNRATYAAASLTLKPNDTLVLYTDGVTEAMNGTRELFTRARLMECLQEAPAVSAADLAARIHRSVERFAAGARPSDDLTLVVLRYLGPQSPGQELRA